ncbi:hypothetical protein SAMN05444169_5911 [Bradyrhizobium erythrophlei]|uniref:Uncharacterized protein n=2 Tax=Bradyrhizobium erythrophlei TaxID=1437360 RepID=A0A1M5QGD1_9BRAD|nr:hypothetical protein SAMN05444169_5911 [Bradyrhizobium erythrophlei]
MKAAPPGWEPHTIMSRIDGWVVDPENEDRIPPVIAEMIARAMPEPNEIEVIRAPMIAGQRVVEREHTYE